MRVALQLRCLIGVPTVSIDLSLLGACWERSTNSGIAFAAAHERSD